MFTYIIIKYPAPVNPGEKVDKRATFYEKCARMSRMGKEEDGRPWGRGKFFAKSFPLPQAPFLFKNSETSFGSFLKTALYPAPGTRRANPRNAGLERKRAKKFSSLFFLCCGIRLWRMPQPARRGALLFQCCKTVFANPIIGTRLGGPHCGGLARPPRLFVLPLRATHPELSKKFMVFSNSPLTNQFRRNIITFEQVFKCSKLDRLLQNRSKRRAN